MNHCFKSAISFTIFCLMSSQSPTIAQEKKEDEFAKELEKLQNDMEKLVEKQQEEWRKEKAKIESKLQQMEVPAIYDDPNSSKITVAYRFQTGNSSEPVLVFFAGGPGQKALLMSEILRDIFPSKYGLLIIDPRSVGYSSVPEEFWNNNPIDKVLTSEAVARDAIAIVNFLKIKKVLIFGASYGTIPATIMAHMAEAEGSTQVAALFLQGVMGRAFTDSEHFVDAKQVYEASLKSLAPEFQESIRNGEYAYRDNAQILGGAIIGQIQKQQDPKTILTALVDIEAEDPMSQTADRAVTSVFVDVMLKHAMEEAEENLKKTQLDLKDPFYVVIGCNEAFPYLRVLEFLDGELSRPTDADRDCERTGTKSPYDSASYPLQNVPIVYFQDTQDFNTPIWQAEYHANNQTQTSRRTFVKSFGQGHNPLIRLLTRTCDKLFCDTSNIECGKKIWKSVLSGNQKDIQSATRYCKSKGFEHDIRLLRRGELIE